MVLNRYERKRCLIGVLLLALIFAPRWMIGQTVPVRIMPLGDSITESYTGYASYRYHLWHALSAAGFSVDFVGSMSGVHAGPPLHSDFDMDHEGHWGWRVDEILPQIGSWSSMAQPDVVLIHLGHNDLWQGQGIAGTIDELGQVIDAIRVENPFVITLLAQVIPAIPGIGLDQIPAFNDEILTLAALLDTPEAPVVVVDQHTGFDPSFDTWDGVHPNETGEPKMADRWLEALVDQLGTPVSTFHRGDCNTDGVPNLADAITILVDLFSSPMAPCADACDVNDDGELDIADPIALLFYLFDSGPLPPQPFGTCGIDLTVDTLACDLYGPCP